MKPAALQASSWPSSVSGPGSARVGRLESGWAWGWVWRRGIGVVGLLAGSKGRGDPGAWGPPKTQAPGVRPLGPGSRVPVATEERRRVSTQSREVREVHAATCEVRETLLVCAPGELGVDHGGHGLGFVERPVLKAVRGACGLARRVVAHRALRHPHRSGRFHNGSDPSRPALGSSRLPPLRAAASASPPARDSSRVAAAVPTPPRLRGVVRLRASY